MISEPKKVTPVKPSAPNFYVANYSPISYEEVKKEEDVHIVSVSLTFIDLLIAKIKISKESTSCSNKKLELRNPSAKRFQELTSRCSLSDKDCK